MSEETAQVVLNVNDDVPTRYLLSRALRDAGLVVVEAGTGQEALERVREAPALVLLDVQLPDIDGFTVCHRIKADPTTAGTMVVHISAVYTEDAKRAEGLERGADGYMVQPVDDRVLVATIRAFLRLQRAEAEVRRMNLDLERRVLARTVELDVAIRKLELRNRKLDAFAGLVSHDLKAPLRRLQLLADKAIELNDGQDELADFLARIRSSSDQMSARVTDVEHVARVGAAGGTMGLVDLDETVAEALQDYVPELTACGMAVAVGHLPTVDGDPNLLRELFSNLVGNAIKFRQSQGVPELSVSAHRDDAARSVVVEVRDNGIGFDDGQREFVFGLFNRLQPTKYPGSGAGLAICREIAEAHGGSITATSAIGCGSTFSVRFPAGEG
jgi:signal transduction histidine kinase